MADQGSQLLALQRRFRRKIEAEKSARLVAVRNASGRQRAQPPVDGTCAMKQLEEEDKEEERGLELQEIV